MCHHWDNNQSQYSVSPIYTPRDWVYFFFTPLLILYYIWCCILSFSLNIIAQVHSPVIVFMHAKHQLDKKLLSESSCSLSTLRLLGMCIIYSSLLSKRCWNETLVYKAVYFPPLLYLRFRSVTPLPLINQVSRHLHSLLLKPDVVISRTQDLSVPLTSVPMNLKCVHSGLNLQKNPILLGQTDIDIAGLWASPSSNTDHLSVSFCDTMLAGLGSHIGSTQKISVIHYLYHPWMRNQKMAVTYTPWLS